MATQTVTEQNYTIAESLPVLQSGPKWLTERRQAERNIYHSTPVPPRGLHLWRYTDPQRFLIEPDKLTATTVDTHDAVEKIELEHLSKGHLSAFVVDHGGVSIDCHLGREAEEKGVTVSPLSDALDEFGDDIRPHLYSLISGDTGKFVALNGALWQDGVLIRVPDNTTLEMPLHILHEAGTEGTVAFPRTLIVAGRNAEVTIVDEYCGGPIDHKDGLAYSNGAVEIIGQADSRTKYLYLQRQGRGTVSYLVHRARLERGASMVTMPFSFGGAVSKQNFGVILDGPGADSRMYGVLFGTGRQHFDNHTLHRHSSGQTYSDIDFKVVLRDRALSAYTGLIGIDQDAMSCEAYQENRNLMLNKGARAETIPELEILNEEVSCSHGATVGPIDDMQTFYLTSRGVPHDEAVRMIVAGFIQPTIRMAPDELQSRLEQVVESRLEDI